MGTIKRIAPWFLFPLCMMTLCFLAEIAVNGVDLRPERDGQYVRVLATNCLATDILGKGKPK